MDVSAGAQTKEGGRLGLLMSFGHTYEYMSPLKPNHPKTESCFLPAPKKPCQLSQTGLKSSKNRFDLA
jgi:hypothetical protein